MYREHRSRYRRDGEERDSAPTAKWTSILRCPSYSLMTNAPTYIRTLTLANYYFLRITDSPLTILYLPPADIRKTDLIRKPTSGKFWKPPRISSSSSSSNLQPQLPEAENCGIFKLLINYWYSPPLAGGWRFLYRIQHEQKQHSIMVIMMTADTTPNITPNNNGSLQQWRNTVT